MNTLLVDVDSIIPNLALMRIARYEKFIGNTPTLVKCNIPIFPKRQKPIIVDCNGFQRMWVSSIFEGTFKNISFVNDGDMIFASFGGTGINIESKLPDAIDVCAPDYSIYPETNTGYAFLSRGCIRICADCVVPIKEGKLRCVVNHISDVVTHPKMKFLDNNFLALPNHIELLTELKDMNLRCQFNQGLDIRLVTDANAKLLSELNYEGEYIFAFDRLEYQPIVERRLAILKKYIKTPWKIKFFIYCHPRFDIKTDVYKRILWCKENMVLPYLMRHLSCWGDKNERTYNDFSAWCNQPGIFKNHTYEQFCQKRRPQKGRIDVLPEWYK